MKIFKNRIVLASICLLVAIGFIFANNATIKAQNKTITLVSVTSNIRKGDVIKKEMVSTKTVGSYNMSENFVEETKDVILLQVILFLVS